MSLLSPESLTVFIAPGELLALHWRGLRPQIAEKRLLPVAIEPGSPWRGASQAFADLLDAFPAARRIRVTLSGHLAQYLLMPWRDDLNDAAEELAVARLAFSQTYGETASHWQVRLGETPPGRAKIAAAVDSALLAALEEAAASRQRQLVSIQPYLVAAANYWQASLARPAASWLVLHEEGRLCVALLERGQWRWLRSLRIGNDWPASLPDLLDNEMLLAGCEAAPTEALVFSPATPALTVPGNSRWSLRHLSPKAREHFSPSNDSRFGFALLG